MMASRLPEGPGQQLAPVPPRCRMLRPTSRLASGRDLRGLDGRCRFRTAISPKPSMPRMTSAVDGVDVADVGDEPRPVSGSRWVNSWARCSPRPSMSMAPREAKCSMRPAIWAGQSRLVQKVSLSPSRRTSGRAADRADRSGTSTLRRPFLAQPEHGADDLGDHVARLAHDDGVARPHVLGRDLVLVVQGGQADGRARRRRRARAGRTAWPSRCARCDTMMSVQQGRALLGRELEGDGPAGRLGGGAQLAAQGQVVDLHHHAVDLVVEVVAVLLPVHAVAA